MTARADLEFVTSPAQIRAEVIYPKSGEKLGKDIRGWFLMYSAQKRLICT